MIKEEQIYIGNKFIGDINHETFVIVDIKNDNGTVYVVLQDKKKRKHYVTRNTFKNMHMTEDWRK